MLATFGQHFKSQGACHRGGFDQLHFNHVAQAEGLSSGFSDKLMIWLIKMIIVVANG